MVHFFNRASARLFSGRLAEDARYRPKLGADFDLLKAAGQGVVRSSSDSESQMGLSAVAPGMRCSAPATAFDVDPVDGDRLVIDDVAYLVRSPRRSADRLIWDFTLNEVA